jgi:hypothetical protein
MVEGTPSLGQDSPEVSGETQASETETPVIPEGKLETIKTNALARERAFRVQEKLDEIRSDRAKELITRDTDQTTGQVRNGLFGWKAIRRSIERTLGDIVKSPADYQAAEESVDGSGVKNEHIETMMSEATGRFSSLSGESAKQEMNDLLSTIADRYKLDQEARTTHPVVSKIKAIVGSNSRVINMAVGAAFRIIFKGTTHVAGLGGAVLASAIYGGVSKGIGEYRSAHAELLGNQGWQEELGKLQNNRQKLEIMRQMVANPATLRKYFAGNSSEAFEFFGQYQQLLADVGEQEVEEGKGPEQSIKDIYSQKESSARKRAWRAAGKAATTAALFSAAGYGIAHFVSELLHPDTPEPQENPVAKRHGDPATEPAVENTKASPEGTDSTAQGESRIKIPTTGVAEGEHNITWRWNGITHQPRLEIDHETHLFEVGDDEHARFAEVKVGGNGTVGDTGSTPEEVAKEIARSIGSGRSGESLGINPQQQEEIQKHIANWLREYKSNDLQNGEFGAGTTVRVDASELNDALKSAGIERIDIDRTGMLGSDRPEVTRDARFKFSKEPDVASEDGTLPYPLDMPQPNSPVIEASPEGENINLRDDSSPATGEEAPGSGNSTFPPSVAEESDISDRETDTPDTPTGPAEADIDAQRVKQNWKAIAKLGGALGLSTLAVYLFRKPLKTAFGPVWEKGKKFFSKKSGEEEPEKDKEEPPKTAIGHLAEEEKGFREKLNEDEQKAFDVIANVDITNLSNQQIYSALEKLSEREDIPISFINKITIIVVDETHNNSDGGKHIPAMHRIAANCYERILNSPDPNRLDAQTRALVSLCIKNARLAALESESESSKYWGKVEKISKRYKSTYQELVATPLFESLEAQDKTEEARKIAIDIGLDGFGSDIPVRAKEYIEEDEKK